MLPLLLNFLPPPTPPPTHRQMVSATLYERRFGPYFCQPVIGGWAGNGCLCTAGALVAPARYGSWPMLPAWLAHIALVSSPPPPLVAPSRPASTAGLEPDGTPYLCGMDSIGAQETAKVRGRSAGAPAAGASHTTSPPCRWCCARPVAPAGEAAKPGARCSAAWCPVL